MKLGERIRQLRESQGWSIRQLSDRTGILLTNISQAERGERPNPTIQTLVVFADAFDMTVAELLTGVDLGEKKYQNWRECRRDEPIPFDD